MKKLSLLTFVILAIFACTKAVDEEPIELNQRGLCFEDAFGNCGLEDDDNGGGGSHFIAFSKGLSSSNINTAKATNSPLAWQDYGATPGAWNTGQGPAAVEFNDKIFLFHASQSSEKVIQSHAEFDTNGNLSWQTTNSNIELGNGVRTNEALTAAVWQNRIFVANKDITDDAIYISRSFLNNGTQYENEELAVTEFENDGGTQSNSPLVGWPPYLTVYQNKLYIFWVRRATGSVFYKVKETLNGPWGPAMDITGYLAGVRKEAAYGIAATEFNGKLFIAYPSDDNNRILTRQVLPLDPGIQNVTENDRALTTSRPSMTTDGIRMMIVYKDFFHLSQNEIYYTFSTDNLSWVADLKGRSQTHASPYVIHVNGN